MADLWPIVTSVLGVFLVMVAGAFCRNQDWLTPEADRSLANLAANVLLPAYFIHRILDGPQFTSPGAIWLPSLYGFMTTAIGFGIAFGFARLLGRYVGLDTDSKQRAFGLCVGICNYGYIPLPLAEKYYQDAMLDLILHNVGVDLALWSVGVAIISGAADRVWRRAIFSPPFLAVIFAMSVRHFSLESIVPVPLITAVGTLGDCAIPMGLLLSGAIIVDFLRDTTWMRAPGVLLSSIAIRQGLLAVLMLLAATTLPPDSQMRIVAMLQAAMPVAVFPIVLVRLYSRDTQTALRAILSTSFAGILLIPIWLAIGKWWLGV